MNASSDDTGESLELALLMRGAKLIVIRDAMVQRRKAAALAQQRGVPHATHMTHWQAFSLRDVRANLHALNAALAAYEAAHPGIAEAADQLAHNPNSPEEPSNERSSVE